MRPKHPAGEAPAGRSSVPGLSGILRWSVLLLAVLLVGVAAPTSAAQATAPDLDLGSATIVDRAGALSPADHARVGAELRELSRAHGIDLYAVLVDRFTDPDDRQRWADAVAKRNGLSKTQYILAVATESRQFTVSADDAGPLGPDQLDALEAATKPFLSKGDYAGAVSAAAGSATLALAASPSSVPSATPPATATPSATPAPSPAPPSARAQQLQQQSADESARNTVLGTVILLAILGALGFGAVRKRRAENAKLEQLERESATALVTADEATRRGTQELDYARAQFGDDATQVFATGIARARAFVDQGFGIRQQLDDDVPDTRAQRKAWAAEILDLCARASGELQTQLERFDAIRTIEQDGAGALAAAARSGAVAATALDGTVARVERLQQRYGGPGIAAVSENPAYGRALLEYAQQHCGAAQSALDSGDTSRAAVSIRIAQESIAQIPLLETAVGGAEQALAAAEQRALALIADLEQDLFEISGIDDPDGRLARGGQATRLRIDEARAQLSGPQFDPLTICAALEAANTETDALIAGGRDAQARAEREARLLDDRISGAAAQVSAAEGFIGTRRGAVGAKARTRNAEALGSLQQAYAHRDSDPGLAAQYAQRARDLATRALRHAQQDVDALRREQRSAEAQQQAAALSGFSWASTSRPQSAAFGAAPAQTGFSGSRGFSAPTAGTAGTNGDPDRDGGSRTRRGGGHF